VGEGRGDGRRVNRCKINEGKGFGPLPSSGFSA
jgi:hypothetical protein